MNNEPDFSATFTVHTPSGATPCCERHAKSLVALMHFMGAHAHAVPITDTGSGPLLCTNCVNEAAKRPC